MPKDFIHAATGLIVRVDEDAGGGYFALVPALPGCGSQGETVSETLENVSDALVAVLDVIRQDQPERYANLTGSGTTHDEETSEPSLTGPAVEIVAET
jgi:predicted RNase H-like HicB family nuclease